MIGQRWLAQRTARAIVGRNQTETCGPYACDGLVAIATEWLRSRRPRSNECWALQMMSSSRSSRRWGCALALAHAR
jgi:hypothetical protein